MKDFIASFTIVKTSIIYKKLNGLMERNET